MPYVRKRLPLDPCPVETVLSIVSGKWKTRIIYLLSLDALTFSELLKATKGLKQQVLSSALKELEADGIIERLPQADAGRRPAYRLTSEGLSLFPILTTIAEWGSARLARSGVFWVPPVSPRATTGARRLLAHSALPQDGSPLQAD